MSDWKERQSGEIEALGYIFGDDMVVSEGNDTFPTTLYVEVKGEDYNEESPSYCPLILSIVLPNGYPVLKNSIPEISFEYKQTIRPGYSDLFLPSRWLSSEDEKKIITFVSSTYSSSPDEIVYDIFDFTKNNIVFPKFDDYREVEYVEDFNLKQRILHDEAEDDNDAGEFGAFLGNISENDKISTSTIVQYIKGLKLHQNRCKPHPDIKFTVTETLLVRKSTFQAYAIILNDDLQQILNAFETIYSDNKLARATHNIFAYKVTINGREHIGFDDDGEDAAGKRLASVLDAFDTPSVLVVVARWFGGVLLGPSRFRYINSMGQDVLETMGFSRKKK